MFRGSTFLSRRCQKRKWGRTPDKNDPDIALSRFFLKMFQNGCPGGVPERAREPTFRNLFLSCVLWGLPEGPGSPKWSPRVPKRTPGLPTHPRGCQNAPPEVPWATSWALPLGSEYLLPNCPGRLCRRTAPDDSAGELSRTTLLTNDCLSSALKARWRGRRRQIVYFKRICMRTQTFVTSTTLAARGFR